MSMSRQELPEFLSW